MCAYGARMKSISVGGGQQSLTTDPVSVTPAEVAAANPEWLDALGVHAQFSIRRSLLYELDKGGHIKSVSLRRRGRSRGKRLFSVPSIRSFLEKQMKVANAARRGTEAKDEVAA
jgi:hypothetical protein